jgi:hypothetical protein
MTARWHLGPIEGFDFWRILVTSPEILVFLFFMITDPKTIPKGPRRQVFYAVTIGLLAVFLIAPARTEYWSKVAVLGALAIVCLARPLLERFLPPIRLGARRLAVACALGLALYGGGLFTAGLPARPGSAAAAGARYAGPLPPIDVRPSKGVDSKLSRETAKRIVRDLMGDLSTRDRVELTGVSLWLEPGGQGGSIPVARLAPGGETVELGLKRGRYVIARRR